MSIRETRILMSEIDLQICNCLHYKFNSIESDRR